MTRVLAALGALCLPVVMLASSAVAQSSADSYLVRGVARDKGGQPLGDVHVYIDSLGVGAHTDAAGNYQFAVPGPGPHRVRGSLGGYLEVMQVVTLSPGATRLDFEMLKRRREPPSAFPFDGRVKVQLSEFWSRNDSTRALRLQLESERIFSSTGFSIQTDQTMTGDTLAVSILGFMRPTGPVGLTMSPASSWIRLPSLFEADKFLGFIRVQYENRADTYEVTADSHTTRASWGDRITTWVALDVQDPDLTIPPEEPLMYRMRQNSIHVQCGPPGFSPDICDEFIRLGAARLTAGLGRVGRDTSPREVWIDPLPGQPLETTDLLFVYPGSAPVRAWLELAQAFTAIFVRNQYTTSITIKTHRGAGVICQRGVCRGSDGLLGLLAGSEP